LAGDTGQARRYFTLAGDVARRVNAYREAVAHYGRSLTLALQQADVTDTALRYLFEQYGRSLELADRQDDAEAHYLHMAEVAEQRRDRSLGLTAVIARATLYILHGVLFDPVRGRQMLQEALILAQELGAKTAETRILWNLMLQHFFVGEIEQARSYGETALTLARQLEKREQLAYILNDLAGYIYTASGMYEESYAALTEARALWHELNNISMLADNLFTTAFNYHHMRGEYMEAVQLVQEAYRINVSLGNMTVQTNNLALLGILQIELGQIIDGLANLQESLRQGEAMGNAALQVIAGMGLAKHYALLGRLDLALPVAQTAVTHAETQITFWLPFTIGILAFIQTRLGNLAEAERVLARLPADFMNNNMVFSYVWALVAQCELAFVRGEYGRIRQTLQPHIPHFRQRQEYGSLPLLLYYEGRAWQGEGQLDKAQHAYHEAIQLAEQSHAVHNLWPPLAALSEIEADAPTAVALRQKAKDIIYFIAEQSPEEMGASFLNLPYIQAVLRGNEK
jgi:tetratricopeptide (TPR) repeat protein